MKFPVFLSLSVCLASAARIPKSAFFGQELGGLRQEETANSKVGVVSGYAQVRRQGRTLGGDAFQFKHPLTVRYPLAIHATSAGRASNSIRPTARKLTRLDMGPVFSLENMLRKEAAKLRAKVETAELKTKIEQASAKAVLAAEKAKKELVKLEEIVIEDTAQLESMIDEAAAIRIAEIEAPVEEEEAQEDEGEKIQATDKSEDGEAKDSTKNFEEPSSDIDLGSVEEV